MGQKSSTTSTPNQFYQPPNYNTAQNIHSVASSVNQWSEQTKPRIRKEPVFKENATNENANIQQVSSLQSAPFSSSNRQPGFQSSRASMLANKNTIVPINQAQQKSEVGIYTGRSVAVKNTLQKHEETMTKMVGTGSNNLSKTTSPPLQVNCSDVAGVTDLPNKSEDATYREEKKELNINVLYPDLSGVELACSDRNSVQEALDVTADSKDYKSTVKKSVIKLVCEGTTSSSHRQRIRNRRKPRIVSADQNFHPLVSKFEKQHLNTCNNFSFQSEASEFTTVNCNLSESTVNSELKQNMECNVHFNEQLFLSNANVVLRMLDAVNLEISSDATKIMLKKLHDKLIEIHGKNMKDDNASSEKFLQQKVEPQYIFESLSSVNRPSNSSGKIKIGDDLSEEENNSGSKTTVQHLCGDVYFCVACELDLHGSIAVASHDCMGDSIAAIGGAGVDDAKSQSGSEVAQLDMQTEVQHMWREVNRVQKGRWYNFRYLKDNTYQCTMCDLNLHSTHDVIKHVKQKSHQQLLAQKRAEETGEERMWRQVPKGSKFNRKHFIVIKNGGSDVLVCNACMCEVPFVFSNLMSHILSNEHIQEVRELRKK